MLRLLAVGCLQHFPSRNFCLAPPWAISLMLMAAGRFCFCDAGGARTPQLMDWIKSRQPFAIVATKWRDNHSGQQIGYLSHLAADEVTFDVLLAAARERLRGRLAAASAQMTFRFCAYQPGTKGVVISLPPTPGEYRCSPFSAAMTCVAPAKARTSVDTFIQVEAETERLLWRAITTP